MSRFIEGEDRSQATLLPEYLDDYIAETIRFAQSTPSSKSSI